MKIEADIPIPPKVTNSRNSKPRLKPKDRFGEYEVLKYLRKTSYSVHVYLCKCSCGIECEVLECNLISGKSKQCRKCGILQTAIKKKEKSFNNGKFLGVSKDKKSFRASFQRKLIGCFETETEAALAYDKKALEVKGTDAVLNFPDMSEFEE